MTESTDPAPSYLFQVGHGTGVAARVVLNDLPMYSGNGQQNITVSGPANHLLLPGLNTVLLEIFPAPRPADAPTIEGPVVFTMRLDVDEGTIVHRVKWPDVAEILPEAQQVLPFAHTSTFTVDNRIPKPVYLDAPPSDFPLEGTPAQHAVVREVLDALSRRDIDGFMALHTLKLEERQKANPGHGELAAHVQKKALAGWLQKPWIVRPTPMDELAFESRCGGRVAVVTRPLGGRAVEAVNSEDPSETFSVDLYLTRHEGRWRVFR